MTHFKIAYGVDAVKSKHHNSAMHIGDNARLFDGRAIDCFTQERKGKPVKLASESICKPEHFERTTLLRVVHGDLRNLDCAELFSNRLRGKAQPHRELANMHGASQCLVATSMFWEQISYSIDDLILVDTGTPCFVEAALCFDGCRFALLVSQCTAGVHVTHTASRWEMHREHSGVLFLDES